jgi:hypothetical protein
MGLEIEVQNLRTAVGVEFHESRLVIESGGLEVEVPADAIAGHPYSPELTALYDSDGDLNDLAGVFGIRYTGSLAGGNATVVPGHPLVEGVASLFMIEGNALALSIEGRPFSTLATAEDGLVAAVVGSGDNGGEVIALADIGLLVSMFGEPTNFEFWQNLAGYARDRGTR